MKLANKSKLTQAVLVLVSATFLTTRAQAQDYSAPPSFSPGQLDNLVSRIALYPDPLLAQIFAAASFPEQIPDAARWADQYRNLRGSDLADAMYQANLQFDPAVQALIPFATVLDMMAREPDWTADLGNAVLADRSAVMDAVQRMRRSAEEYGYLRSNQQIQVVDTGESVEIEPADPSLIYVPVYDPYVVYAPPRPGFFIGGAIGFGPYYSIGAFGGWGWGGGFNWRNHAVFVNHVAWGRNWYNRDAYVHNYGNWDRGAWRNAYESRNNHFRNEGSRDGHWNTAGSYRGQSSPVVPDRNVERGNSFRNSRNPNTGVQSAPVIPNRSNDRGNSGNINQGRQFVPVTRSHSFEHNTSPNSGNRGGSQAGRGGNEGRHFGRSR